MSSKKKKHEEEENAERWLLTYADMITLLVAFFMMMYSMSVLNLEKFKAAAIGIRSGFNGPSLGKKHSGDSMIEKGLSRRLDPELGVVIVPPAKPRTTFVKRKSGVKRPLSKKYKPTAAQRRAQRVQRLTKEINCSLMGVAQGEAARVVAERTGVAIELIGDLIFFPKGTAHLSEEAKDILRAVISVLSVLDNEISVEGYTSKFEASEAGEFSNSWELSTARAMAVVNFMMESGKINPKRISITGFGQFRPIRKKNKTTAKIDENDRVRIFIYQE